LAGRSIVRPSCTPSCQHSSGVMQWASARSSPSEPQLLRSSAQDRPTLRHGAGGPLTGLSPRSNPTSSHQARASETHATLTWPAQHEDYSVRVGGASCPWQGKYFPPNRRCGDIAEPSPACTQRTSGTTEEGFHERQAFAQARLESLKKEAKRWLDALSP